MVRPHGIGWRNNEKRTHDIAFIAGSYEPGNATLVSETCPSIWRLSSKIMVQFCAMISAPLRNLFDIFLISLCTGMEGEMGLFFKGYFGNFDFNVRYCGIIQPCGMRFFILLANGIR